MRSIELFGTEVAPAVRARARRRVTRSHLGGAQGVDAPLPGRLDVRSRREAVVDLEARETVRQREERARERRVAAGRVDERPGRARLEALGQPLARSGRMFMSR